MEIEPVTMQLATRISAAVVDLEDLCRRIDAMKPKEAGDVYSRTLALEALVKEFVGVVKGGIKERLEEHKPVLVQTAEGLVPLELKASKKVKCNKPAETAWAILEEGGPEALVPLLSSKPFKPAACEKVLGEAWKNHFAVEWGTKAEPGKKVMRLANEPDDAEQEEIVDE